MEPGVTIVNVNETTEYFMIIMSEVFFEHHSFIVEPGFNVKLTILLKNESFKRGGGGMENKGEMQDMVDILVLVTQNVRMVITV